MIKTFTFLLMSFIVIGSSVAQTLSYRHTNAGSGNTDVTATVDYLTEGQSTVSLDIYSDIYNGSSWTSSGNYDYYVNESYIGSSTSQTLTVDLTEFIPVASVKVVSKASTWSVVSATVTVTENTTLAAGPTVADMTYCKDEEASQVEATLSGDGTSLKWYTSVYGEGYTTTAPIPLTTEVGSKQYFVAQVNNQGVESERSVITIDVVDTPTLTCADDVTVSAELTQDEINTEFIDFLGAFSNTDANSMVHFTSETNGFTGAYSTENWTTPENSTTSGYTHSASSLNISASSGGTTRQIIILADGTISFDWSSNFTGSGSFILAYKINGVRYDLATTTQSGTTSDIEVSMGDEFAIYTWGGTQYSSFSASISNFIVKSELPDISTTEVGFVNTMAPSEWTTPENSVTSGYSNDESSLNISASSGGTTRQITIPEDGTISFDWNANFTGSGSFILAYKINGVRTELATSTQSGSTTNIEVSKGDEFAIYTWGGTQYSSFTASISNFSYTYSSQYLGAVSRFSEVGGAIDVTYVVNNACGEYSCTKTFTATVPTAIESNSSASLSLFPNPTNGIATIELPEAGIINIFDLSGNQVSSFVAQTGQNTINISLYQSGIYIVQYLSNNNTKTIKLVKK